MAFGVFDLLHDGHRHFFSEAKKLGDKLIVVLATDNTVKMLKNHLPINSFNKRLENLKKESLVDEVILGDEVLDSWTAIPKYKPDTMAIGYDQTELEKSLKKFITKNLLSIRLVKISPHKDGVIHSSTFRSKV